MSSVTAPNGRPRTVRGCRTPATTYPARAQIRKEAAYCWGSPLRPWLKTMSGNGPLAGLASATSVSDGAPSAGYQRLVTSRRRGASGCLFLGSNARLLSTNVTVRTPTA